MNHRFAVLLVLAGALGGADAATSHFQRAGLWETTVVLERDGKKREPIVKQRCITQDQVEQAENELFAPFATGCTGKRTDEGTTVRWTYECSGTTSMKGSGQLTWGKDRYTGTSESFADLSKGQKLQMLRTHVEFKARRVGECEVPDPKRSAPVRERKEAPPVIG